MKHLLSLLLLLPLFLFTACDQTPPPTAEDDSRSTVFAGEVLTLPDGWTVNNFPTLSYDGDVLTVDAWRYSEQDTEGDGWHDYEETVMRLHPDGTPADSDDNTDNADGSNGVVLTRDGGRITRTAALSDGKMLACEMLYTDYEVGCYVHLYDPNGNLVTTVQPARDFGYDLSRDIKNLAGDVFSVTNLLAVPAVGENQSARIGILTTKGFAVYEENGTLSFKLDDSGTSSAVIDTAAGLLFLTENRQGTQSLRKIDLLSGKLGDTVTLPEELTVTTPGTLSTKLLSGVGHDLYAYNARGLYGVDFTDDAMTTLSTPVIDWAASGIAPFELRAVCMIDEKTAAIAIADSLNTSGRTTVLSLYRMVPPDEIVPKIEIVLAKLTDDYMLQYAVRDFNRQSQTHRVVIRDYTQYDRDAQKRAFDTDIAAGNIPDMVIMGSASNMFDTFVPTYERSGLFADLTPLLQADGDFDYDNLLGYVTKPYFFGGAQYLFPLSPYQRLWFGHAEDFGEGGGVTYDEFLSVMERCAAEGKALTTWDSPLRIVMDAAVHEHYDEINAVCSFDDGVLSALNHRARVIPTRSDTLPDGIRADELFRQGQIRLYLSEAGFSNLYSYAKAMLALGGDAVAIGNPTADGTLCMGRTLTEYFSVTNASDEKAACIDFLQTMIDLKRSQNFGGKENSGGFTFYHKDIEEQLAGYAGKTIVINNGMKSVLNDEDAADEPGVHIKLTRADADAFAAMLDGIGRSIDNNTKPASIFWEEFYNEIENKSFDEIMKLIQSKVSIYLSEQMG